MASLLKCRSCRHRSNCEIADRLQAAIKGLHITSMRHTCQKHELPYRPGQAVWAYLYAGAGDEDGPAPQGWFPGHFLGQSRRGETRALVFIEPGVEDRDKQCGEFEPTRGEGVCKAIWKRIEARDAPDLPVCHRCGQLEGMTCQGSGYNCGNAICPTGKVDDDRPAEVPL